MLKFDFITDPDVDRAIGELLDNVVQLATSGHADIAYRALCRLSEDGPWRLPRFGSTRNRYEGLLLKVCSLAGVESPATSCTPAMSVDALREWAFKGQIADLNNLVVPVRVFRSASGLAWSTAYLATLASRLGAASGDERVVRQDAMWRFTADAERVLQSRVARQFQTHRNFGIVFAEDLRSFGQDWSAMPVPVYDIAPEAHDIDTLEIVKTIDRCISETGLGGGVLHAIFSCALLLLLEQRRESAAKEVAEIWMRLEPHACRTILEWSVAPCVAAWIGAGGLSQTLGINRHLGEQWLECLNQRPPAAIKPSEKTRRPPARTSTLQQLQVVLEGTALTTLNWVEVSSGDIAPEVAFMAELNMSGDQAIDLWQAARDLCDRTGRWPVLCCDLDPEQHFSRFGYQQGAAADDVSPAAIIAAAEAVDLPAFLATLEDNQLTADDWLQIWAHEWKALGLPADDVESLWIESGQNRLRCEHLLAERERERGVTDPQRGRPASYPPEQIVLMLLPTTEGPDALAYMHWFGMERGRPEGYVRLLQHWSERYGAELYAHYGTMLEFKVSRPPADLETALELAREHELVAPATLILPGIALRHYAEGLIDHPMWFLHERP